MGGILFPALIKGKYPERFSLGLITTSGTLSLLFPPSLPLIIYAIVAKVRIDQLFLAGILPGILLVLLLALFSVQKAVRFQVPRTPFKPLEVVHSVREIFWELPLPLVVIGSGLRTSIPKLVLGFFF
jgi:TRAP-type C4-dicarboxylate transport system permease large subunit